MYKIEPYFSETKPEIPAARLDAAAEALLKSSYGFNKAAARSVAGIALKAAGVAALLEENQKLRELVPEMSEELAQTLEKLGT